MDREQLKRIIDSPETYDESREESVYAWLRDCHGQKMRWVIVLVYVQYIILLAPMVYSTVTFFRTDQVGSQIMHATIVLLCNLWMGFISVFAWVMLQRPRISREFKRLELRIAELSEAVNKE